MAGRAGRAGPENAVEREGTRVGMFLRHWWPVLAVAALALLSVEVLRSSYDRWEDLLQQSAAATDNISESQRRLVRAYLMEQRRGAGDATFAPDAALAQVRAAENALRNWLRGRSTIAGIEGAPVSDSLRIELGRRYHTALSGFGEALAERPVDPVQLRNSFSTAEQAGRALESAVHAGLRETIAAEERRQRLWLAGWGLLLLVAGLGLALGRRALSHAEAAQSRTLSRLSRLRAVAPVGIVECDEDGRIQAANTAWSHLTAVAESEWEGRPWWGAFGHGDRERAEVMWDELIDFGSEETAELRIARGSTAGDREPGPWVLVRTARGAPDPSGTLRWVVTFTDITERRKVEDQLHHAQKMEAVGRLAGGVAHDFNNLLTSIGGFATLTRENVPGDSPLQEDLREIERGVERGRALTRQLLTFSRQERIQPETHDLRTIVRELERMLGRLVREDIELRVEAADQPAPVLADRGQLEQVVTNLVVNAADAMSDGGRIRIAVAPVQVQEAFPGARSEVEPGQYALLTVADTGTGIPPAVREHMFEPFFTSKEPGKGTGLGLSTVWGIVRQSGGHIHVYTEEGHGTVFKIYLPATVGIDTGRAEARETTGTGGPGPTGTALVVEDEAAVRRLTVRVLQLQGWTVLEAADGAEALDLFDQHPDAIDILITDVIMRGMGGIELTEQLRARDRQIPTLFVSGYADSEIPIEGDHFLEKPFAPRALVECVHHVLRSAEQDAP